MTDKQIIIDGVDVSGCLHYSDRDGYCEACKDDIDGYSFTKCSSEDNCYYKQLKRKEQECEFSNLKIIQLQETLSQYETDLSTKDCIVETCKAQYKELKAENDELKKRVKGEIHLGNKYKEDFVEQFNEAEKLKQTLQEIKEIAENRSNYPCGKCIKTEILQKISEVI